MKDKFKPFDISIVSAYMGRFQTGIVALLVIGLTAHAYITRDSARGHITLTMAVPGDGDRFEPLARMIARRTARSVDLSAGGWDSGAELFVMPPAVFFEKREALGLAPLFSLSEHPGDRALIVGGRGQTTSPADAVGVLFTAPGSVNGCWVQLQALSRRSAHFPENVDSLRFDPAGDGHAVVWAVRHGVARFGACRQSDLRGVGAGDINVLFQTPALPDLILAARSGDRSHFLGKLENLPASFDSPEAADRDAVELLRARGIGSLRALPESQVAELGLVWEFVAGLGVAGGSP